MIWAWWQFSVISIKQGWRPVMPLSTLWQCSSWEPSMVVVRRYSNTPYIPRGTSHSLHLDMGNLSGGVASTQFSLDRLHLYPASIQQNRGATAHWGERRGFKDILPSPQSSYGIVWRRITIFLVPFLCQSPWQPLHCFWKCASRPREE